MRAQFLASPPDQNPQHPRSHVSMAEPSDLPDHDYPVPEAEPPVPEREKPMGFFDHLEELRWTLVKCAMVFMAFAILIGVFMKQFNDVIMWPLHHVQEQMLPKVFTLDLGTTSVMEPFTIIIQMCLMGGLTMSAPFMLYFIGQFVAPALNPKELRMVLPTAFLGLVLFLAGAAFSFFLLVPSTLRVSLELNELFGFTQRWTPGAYYSLLTWLTLGVGAAFEFPLLIVLLIYMGLVTVAKLRSWWRHALVIVFVIAALVTPTPDPVTQTMLALPLYALYWLAIIIGSRVEKRTAS